MQQRGRKSAAEKAGLGVIDGFRGSRVAPPADLTDYEAAKWAEVLGAMPDDWFSPEMTDMMRAYCRCSKLVFEIDCMQNKLDSPDVLEKESVPDVMMMLRMIGARDKAVRQLVMLARSLRLTPQSRTDPKTAGRAKRKAGETVKQPWDD